MGVGASLSSGVPGETLRPSAACLLAHTSNSDFAPPWCASTYRKCLAFRQPPLRKLRDLTRRHQLATVRRRAISSGKAMSTRSMRILYWEGPLPGAGDLLLSAGGTYYRVVHSRLTRPGSKSLAVLSLLKLCAEDDLALNDAQQLHRFHWCSRERRLPPPPFTADGSEAFPSRRAGKERP